MPFELSDSAPFKPKLSESMALSFKQDGQLPRTTGGDRRDGRVYIYTPQIVVAVNVALVTSRPLLLRGPSGSGKSSLARNVAFSLGWRYYEQVISSRTEARDLLWQFDLVRRLSDATSRGEVLDDAQYIEPGVLWWAFDPERARRRGLAEGQQPVRAPIEPVGDRRDHARAVVLLDEIDKADPDVPNNLLVPLGSFEFEVPGLDLSKITALERPFVVLTTNDERDLPPAFVRRCVVLKLTRPSQAQLVNIASEHFGAEHVSLYRRVARLMASRSRAADADRQAPSTAEYLDAVSACLELQVQPGGTTWKDVARATLFKPLGPADIQ